jgi:DNA topoisomerase-2
MRWTVAHNNTAEVFYNVKKIHNDIGDDGWISIMNDGDGLGSHIQSGIHIPQLAFGQMLTSTNYDDSQDRITGGMKW